MSKYIYVIAFLIVTLCSISAAAQDLFQSEPPPLVRLTGTFLPPAEQGQRSLSILTVSIKQVKWAFKVAKLEKLTGKAATDLQILQSLFPPELRLIGPPELLSPLQEPGITNKSFAIEGHLYIGDRILFVTTVEEVEQNPKQARPSRILQGCNEGIAPSYCFSSTLLFGYVFSG